MIFPLLLLGCLLSGGACFRMHQDFSNNVQGFYLSRCFLLVYNKVDWHTAKHRCRLMGGFLAKPNTQHLNNWLKSKLMEKNPNQAAWFGLNKMSNGWCHIDGSLVSRGYTDWAPGEPNNYGGVESCGNWFASNGHAYRWNDSPCGTKLPFVCQRNGC